MAAVVEPVVEQQHRAILQDRRERGERVARRFVQVAIEVRERDLRMRGRKRRRQRLVKRPTCS